MSPTIRARAVECLLAVGLVAAGWKLLLRPAEQSFADKKAELTRVQRQVDEAATLTSSVAQVEAQAAATGATLRALRSAETSATSSARLYDSVNRLAASSAVKVIRLDPTGLRQVGVTQPMGQRPGDKTDQGCRGEVQEYRITIQGSYASVASFIHACEHSLGTSAVTKFRVQPVPDSAKGDVEATVETAHMRLLATADGGKQ